MYSPLKRARVSHFPARFGATESNLWPHLGSFTTDVPTSWSYRGEISGGGHLVGCLARINRENDIAVGSTVI